MGAQTVTQSEVRGKAVKAQQAARRLALATTAEKDAALRSMAEALLDGADRILQANAADVERAEAAGTSKALLDRLRLNRDRIQGMVEGLEQIIGLADPVGEVVRMWRRPNGLQVGQVRTPIGVIAMIYESRPNVTVDASGLCLKAGNAVILRGGSDAIESNRALAGILREAIASAGLPADAVQLIENTDRAAAEELMRLNGLVDLLIPRGGAGLIKRVMETATIPVVETGVGNCHAYVDASADLDMAERIVLNGKVQRPGVCNALETLLVHQAVAERSLPRMVQVLREHGVEIRGCERTRRIVPDVAAATEEDWETEYLDLILAVRVVDSLDEALDHIARYGTRHSETIITQGYAEARRFQAEVDAAAVYVNASTRFTDGFAFGFGAEIGISTQKLHARGPMGLPELTTTKYVVSGDGQIRG